MKMPGGKRLFIGVIVAALLATAALWPGPAPLGAQTNCAPLELYISPDKPFARAMSYTTLGVNHVDLYWNGTAVVFDVYAGGTGSNAYVGPGIEVGIYGATSYLTYDFDPLKQYTLYVEVSNGSYYAAAHDYNAIVGVLAGQDVYASGVYSRTFPGNNPGNYGKLYLRVNSTIPRDSIYTQGRWEITLVEAGCSLPTPTPTPTATPTPTPYPTRTPRTPIPGPTATPPAPAPTPTHAPLRPNVQRYDVGIFLDNPLTWDIPTWMVQNIGVANIRDYLAVMAALMAIARFLRKPPVARKTPAPTQVIIVRE